jgi:ATP-binding cassette, subfamily B, bacterial
MEAMLTNWRMMRPGELDRDAKLSKGTVRRVFRLARPYAGRISLYLALVVVAALLGAVPPLLYRAIVDHAIAPPDRHPDLGLLNVLAVALLLIALVGAVVQVASRWFSAHVGEGVIYDLRVSLFDHVQRMPLAFFTRTQTGALLSRLNGDVVGAQRVFTDILGSVVQTVTGIAAALIVMFKLEWRLALLALVIVPLFLAPTRRMGRIVRRLTRQQMDLNAEMSTQMTERFQVGGALLVKLFGGPEAEVRQFSKSAGEVRDLGIRTALVNRAFYLAFGLVAALGTALVYWIGGRMVIRGIRTGGITLGTLIAFSAYLTQLYAPITMLTNSRVDLLTALISFERVFEVLDFPPSIVERPGAYDLVDARGAVELDHVWFRYPAPSTVSIRSLEDARAEPGDEENPWALTDVSFRIEPGEMVALVGPSGAGKTTMSLLVPRLYDVTEGAVRIDGQDVRGLTLATLSDAVGMVTQDPHLFHDSIRANLLYAKPDASERDIIEAAKAARIHDLFASLPDGYDTTVGERGYRLSGGEKQRLAIARLLLKDPAIMILDEATAHLDSESEVLIQRALAEALAGRSSLVIAHRLSTIVNADHILVVDGGRIVERGTHLELLGAGGLYEDLYRTQFLRAEIEEITPFRPSGRGASHPEMPPGSFGSQRA